MEFNMVAGGFVALCLLVYIFISISQDHCGRNELWQASFWWLVAALCCGGAVWFCCYL